MEAQTTFVFCLSLEPRGLVCFKNTHPSILIPLVPALYKLFFSKYDISAICFESSVQFNNCVLHHPFRMVSPTILFVQFGGYVTNSKLYNILQISSKDPGPHHSLLGRLLQWPRLQWRGPTPQELYWEILLFVACVIPKILFRHIQAIIESEIAALFFSVISWLLRWCTSNLCFPPGLLLGSMKRKTFLWLQSETMGRTWLGTALKSLLQ